MKKYPMSKVTCFRFGADLCDRDTGAKLPDDHEGYLLEGGKILETGIDKTTGERFYNVVGELDR